MLNVFKCSNFTAYVLMKVLMYFVVKGIRYMREVWFSGIGSIFRCARFFNLTDDFAIALILYFFNPLKSFQITEVICATVFYVIFGQIFLDNYSGM